MRARGAQKIADLIEGITLASAVTQGVLLDAASHLTWSVSSERDDMEGIEDAGCALGAGQAMAFLLSLEGDPESRFAPPLGSLLHARPAKFSCAVPDLPGTRSAQAGRGVLLLACQVYDAGERVWVLVGVGPGDATHAHRPPAPAPPQNGQGHQMRLAGTA